MTFIRRGRQQARPSDALLLMEKEESSNMAYTSESSTASSKHGNHSGDKSTVDGKEYAL